MSARTNDQSFSAQVRSTQGHGDETDPQTAVAKWRSRRARRRFANLCFPSRIFTCWESGSVGWGRDTAIRGTSTCQFFGVFLLMLKNVFGMCRSRLIIGATIWMCNLGAQVYILGPFWLLIEMGHHDYGVNVFCCLAFAVVLCLPKKNLLCIQTIFKRVPAT